MSQVMRKTVFGISIQVYGSNQPHYLLKSTLNPGLEARKLFSCSTLLNMRFNLLTNVKMPTVLGIVTFISRINDQL